MEREILGIPDVIVLKPRVFQDSRGYFYESYNCKAFEQATGRSPVFVQDNHSQSAQGVLRGLHYQLDPGAQGKLVRVVQGEVFDVAVDLRKSSATFGRWVGCRLSSENKKQLWIPEGFAHGFVTLSQTAQVLYKATHYYAPDLERCIRWDDPTIGIAWPFEGRPELSEKDSRASALLQAEVFA